MAHPVPPRLNVARAATDQKAPALPAKVVHKLEIQDRRRAARRFRVSGMSVEAIALRLAADPAINSTGEGFPGGYGAKNYADGKPPPSTEALRKEASADLRIAYERSRDSIDRDADHMFDIALERIELVVAGAIARAASGSQLHMGRIIEATDLQARMMGWHKSPVTINVDASTHITAVSPQPTWDPEFLGKFYDAMIEAGAETPEMLEAAQAALDGLPVATSAPADAVLVESSEAPPDATSGG